MLRTLVVVILVAVVISTVLACSQHVSLKGVTNLTCSLTGQKFQATTTDGTQAATKVKVGKSYSLMSQDENGPYTVGKVLITKTRGGYCEGRLVTRT